MKPLRLLALLCLLPAAGCQVLTYKTPGGDRFTRTVLGVNTTFATLLYESHSNGLRRVELRGYRHDSSQALSAVTEAAIRAALQTQAAPLALPR